MTGATEWTGAGTSAGAGSAVVRHMVLVLVVLHSSFIFVPHVDLL